MNRTFTTLAVGALAVLTLTGCGNGAAEQAAAPSPTAAALSTAQLVDTWIPRDIPGYTPTAVGTAKYDDRRYYSTPLEFTKAGWRGWDGCNTVAGGWQSTGGANLDMATEGIISTSAACANVPHERIGTEAATAKVNDDALTIYDKTGKVLATYERSPRTYKAIEQARIAETTKSGPTPSLTCPPNAACDGEPGTYVSE